MSTNFPASADTFPTAADLANDTLATKPHSTLHGNLGDAVLAIETELLFGPIALSDGSFDRAVLASDGSGLTLYDSNGDDRVHINETIGIDLLDAGGIARAALAEGSLGLSGDGVGTILLDVASQGVMNMRDATNNVRVELYNDATFNGYDSTGIRYSLASDGSGLTLYDAGGVSRGSFKEDAGGGVVIDVPDATANAGQAGLLITPNGAVELWSQQGLGLGFRGQLMLGQFGDDYSLGCGDTDIGFAASYVAADQGGYFDHEWYVRDDTDILAEMVLTDAAHQGLSVFIAGETVLQTSDGTENRWSLLSDGSGLTLYDAAGDPTVRIVDDSTERPGWAGMIARDGTDYRGGITLDAAFGGDIEAVDGDGNQLFLFAWAGPTGHLNIANQAADGFTWVNAMLLEETQVTLTHNGQGLSISDTEAGLSFGSAGFSATGSGFSFFGTAQTGIATDAASIHAALVALGLITA